MYGNKVKLFKRITELSGYKSKRKLHIMQWKNGKQLQLLIIIIITLHLINLFRFKNGD